MSAAVTQPTLKYYASISKIAVEVCDKLPVGISMKVAEYCRAEITLIGQIIDRSIGPLNKLALANGGKTVIHTSSLTNVGMTKVPSHMHVRPVHFTFYHVAKLVECTTRSVCVVSEHDNSVRSYPSNSKVRHGCIYNHAMQPSDALLPDERITAIKHFSRADSLFVAQGNYVYSLDPQTLQLKTSKCLALDSPILFLEILKRKEAVLMVGTSSSLHFFPLGHDAFNASQVTWKLPSEDPLFYFDQASKFLFVAGEGGCEVYDMISAPATAAKTDWLACPPVLAMHRVGGGIGAIHGDATVTFWKIKGREVLAHTTATLNTGTDQITSIVATKQSLFVRSVDAEGFYQTYRFSTLPF